MLLIQAAAFFFLDRIPLFVRLPLPYFCNSLFTLLMPFQRYIYKSQETAYAWLIVLIMLFGGFCGLLQATLYGLAGSQGVVHYTAALMVGIGVSNVATNLLRMLFLAILPGYVSGAFTFFVLTALFLLVCGFLGIFLLRNEQIIGAY